MITYGFFGIILLKKLKAQTLRNVNHLEKAMSWLDSGFLHFSTDSPPTNLQHKNQRFTFLMTDRLPAQKSAVIFYFFSKVVTTELVQLSQYSV
jgi:hypothetical protein